MPSSEYKKAIEYETKKLKSTATFYPDRAGGPTAREYYRIGKHPVTKHKQRVSRMIGEV